MMDDFKKANLQRQWENIVNDLQPDHILDELYSRQAIDTHDLENVRSLSIRKDKNTSILNAILHNGDRAFDSFVDVLQKDYDWIHRSLLQPSNEVHDGQQRLGHDIFQDTLVLGNVPRQPLYYVDRTAPLNNLQMHLKELEPTQRIVLHGMTGSGKSCLAAAAVKDGILLHSYFNNRVFWINLGEIKVVDQLPMHMTILLQRLLNDSRESNNKSIRPLSVPLSSQVGEFFVEIELLKSELKNLFRRAPYREALLILDNVSLREATEAFDLGCKTLITTQDKDIITGNNTVYFEVKGGFTELETLQLFAKSLKTQANRLPQQAHRIHHLCKGEPILISLLGSLLEPYKEELLRNSDRWEYYIRKLTKKDYSFKSQLFDAISISIKRLDDDLRNLYRNFAVFVQDINITPQVMQTIWKLEDVHDVHANMTLLQNKSLIVSYYNQELKTYVYGIHDLFLAYLKEELGAAKLVQQHQNLISAYKHITNNNFANLPNDNYIFQYIGYHLKEAHLFDEFSIYFDLNFIGAKIKAIGTADLLRDFHLYRHHITRNDETLQEKLEEYINFVKAKGYDLFKYPNIDIVQCGLGENKDGYIYKAAKEIARHKPKSLYLQLQAPQESVYFTHTIDLKQDVSAACFTGDVNQILVGMKDGDINLWEQAYNQKLNVFSGHTASITYLQLSPDRDGFLSVSEDGSVKIWSLQGVVLQSSNGDICDENGFTKHIPSPRIKQSNWKNFYGNNSRIDTSITCTLDCDYDSDRLISASYSNETSNRIVTGCFTGRVLIWDVKDDVPEISCDIRGRCQRANCVTFSVDDSLVIFSCEHNIFLHNAQNGDFLSNFCNSVYVKSLLIVPELETTLIVINDNSIKLWTWNQVGLQVKEPLCKELDNKSQASFLCAAVTEDGMYLVVGSTDHYIRIWHIGTAKIVQEILNKGLVVCLDTFYDDTKNAVHILLSGSDDKTVKQWHIQPTPPRQNTAKLLPIFDCFWNLSGVPRIAVVNSLNKVQVMNGHNLIMESERMESPIKAVRFSLCGNKIAVGLENGDIMEFDFKARRYETLMKLHDSVVLLKYFNTSKQGFDYSQRRECRNLMYTPQSARNSVMVVATAQNGWVTIYRNNRALCLVQPSPLLSTIVKQVSIIPIVQCFFIRAADKLLTVSQNRTIKVWNLEDGGFDILFGDKTQNESAKSSVTMASVSLDQSLLAITMADGSFEIYAIEVFQGAIKLILNQEVKLDNSVRSCRFSENGKILALGHDNGNIVIWSVESKVAIGTLLLHKSWVRYLLFSPAPGLILISVGDQIAWWDLTKIPDESNRDRYRRRSNSAKKKNLSLDLSVPMSHLNIGLWNDKEGNKDKPHLLSVIKLRGLFSTYISASHDFSSFFTIDKNGYLYIMEMLR